MEKNKISLLTKIILFLSAAVILVVLFVPIWSIYLDAPQYPEGLQLQIWAHEINGDVDIINGLNHYIGMKEIHVDEFVEFKVLPYILIFFSVLFALSAIIGRKKLVYTAFTLFILFGVITMVDFWKWEYDYGHNLDPNAAIQVPGMVYQPPLIGFKQLLNFGAYSIPDIGAWIMVSIGGLLFVCVSKESNLLNRFRKNKKLTVLLLPLLLFSCGSNGPEPISLNKDACDNCKMSISDGKFGAEFVTKKGRFYKFDDLRCMFDYFESIPKSEVANFYIHDYSSSNQLIDATKAFYFYNEELKSPMGGNIAAFATEESAKKFASKYNVSIQSWQEIH
ncbi:MAG TPA: nitrous oxide reductase accessory protein NosL [Fluviicola sp.]|nr:nitrous oxide reductase accessory protein NosL [Fluviicola sp.]